MDSRNKTYVSDVIGQSFKQWKPGYFYFISAGTGTGKSTFVIEQLLSYARETKQRILYLVNREALRIQLQTKIDHSKNHWTTEDDQIKVMTYQGLEKIIKSSASSGIQNYHNHFWSALNNKRSLSPEWNDFRQYVSVFSMIYGRKIDNIKAIDKIIINTYQKYNKTCNPSRIICITVPENSFDINIILADKNLGKMFILKNYPIKEIEFEISLNNNSQLYLPFIGSNRLFQFGILCLNINESEQNLINCLQSKEKNNIENMKIKLKISDLCYFKESISEKGLLLEFDDIKKEIKKYTL